MNAVVAETPGNMEIWNRARTPDPDQTKPIVGKPYKGTTVSFQTIAKMATELFGPCGIGWGWTIDDERVEPLADGELLHVVRLTVWYRWKGERGEVPHIGQTYLVRATKKGLYSDEDAPKKSVTDALTKALSCIGFAADIYMGMFDDRDYVEQVRDDIADRAASPAKDTTTDPPAADNELINDDERDVIAKLAEAAGRSLMDICKSYGIGSLMDLPYRSYDALCDRLRELATQVEER